MPVDFKKRLKEANKNWKKAKTRKPEGSEFEDGKYMARLVTGEVVESGSGRLQVAWSWKFTEGEYKGKVKKSYQGLETEDNLFYLSRDLTRLGYELPEDLEDLPEILSDIAKEKPLCRIALRTGNTSDIQNVYIQRVFSDDEEEEAEAEEAEADETDDTESEDEEESDDESEEEEESDEESEDEEESDEESEEEEEEEGDEEEEGVELKKGMAVMAETAKGRERGTIIELLEEEEKVRLKLDNGKVVRVPVDALELIDEEEEAEEEPPAKKKKKAAKSAPPAKKSAPAKKAAPAKKKAKK